MSDMTARVGTIPSLTEMLDTKLSLTETGDTKLSLADTVQLPNSTVKMPRLGFYAHLPGILRKHACVTAFAAGCRHIDMSDTCEKEGVVGSVVLSTGVAATRSEIFLTARMRAPAYGVNSTYRKAAETVSAIAGEDDDDMAIYKDMAIDEDWEEEGGGTASCGHVDLFLIQHPNFSDRTPIAEGRKREQMWLALERLLAEGKTRAIGVYNYQIEHLEEMKHQYAKVWPPHVNQLRLNPWSQQPELVAYCQKEGIVVQAYGILGSPGDHKDKVLQEISQEHHKSTDQVLVRYALQKGWVTLVDGVGPQEITARVDVYDFELSADEMALLDDL